jgi:hypothetical protein
MEKKGLKDMGLLVAGAIWFPIALCLFIFFSIMAVIGFAGLALPLWHCYGIQVAQHKRKLFLIIYPKSKEVDNTHKF